MLSRKDRQRILTVCKPVQLEFGAVLCDPGEATRHVYFPIEGFISLITRVDDSPGIEVGMVGREGMLGAQLVLGVAMTPLRAVVQGAGHAWRLKTTDFRGVLAETSALRLVLNRYIFVLMAQLAGSAACLRFHHIQPRLARWLLMSHDRARSDSFRVTQEFLAFMLGVRRVGITAAASELQRNGLIEYHRGDLTVLDRPGLEAAACSC